MALAEDAEIIVGELVANAVSHAVVPDADRKPITDTPSLRLLCRSGEVICAVLDPSSACPELKALAGLDECGRGLRLVDAVSDVWGWSPVAGRGKAVWAILFSPD
jgi:hypothetical protein